MSDKPAKDPYRYFRIEARELLDTLQRGILELGVEGGDGPERIRTLMRASHTLKGAAGVVRREAIAKLAHDLEDLFAAKAKPDAMLPLVDAMNAELATLGAPKPAVTPTGPSNEKPTTAESVRLDLDEVDTLLASLSDLSARIGAMRSKTGADLDAMLQNVERLAHDTLEDARRLRLLPADTLFAEIARAAHDAAAHEGRLIEVETFGGDRRLDAHVIGLVRDGLLQIVRNAIAHGIEPAAERAAIGKPKAGKITVRVETHGPRARLSIRDDGRGLDLPAMRSVIVERRLATADEAAQLDATGVMKIAMRSGVTTRTTASELAGRGVGLQVVASTMDRLRGALTVTTAAGAFTEIALTVPVSITAAPALVVGSGEHVVTIPLEAVVRTARVTAAEIVTSADGDVLQNEGENLRFGSLARLLRADGRDTRDMWTAVLLDAGGQRAAIGVDHILGIANAVVQPLPPGSVAGPIVSGASLDGDGNPRLALEPRFLVETVARLKSAPAKEESRATPRILVTDDSLTSRMLEQSILEAAGYDVTTATSGEEALLTARAAPKPFDLFVIDVEMPGMTGFETVARMRADPVLANIPAVLVTSRGAPEDRRRGLEAGARAYIVKGEFAQTEFLDTVRRLIG